MNIGRALGVTRRVDVAPGSRGAALDRLGVAASGPRRRRLRVVADTPRPASDCSIAALRYGVSMKTLRAPLAPRILLERAQRGRAGVAAGPADSRGRRNAGRSCLTPSAPAGSPMAPPAARREARAHAPPPPPRRPGRPRPGSPHRKGCRRPRRRERGRAARRTRRTRRRRASGQRRGPRAAPRSPSVFRNARAALGVSTTPVPQGACDCQRARRQHGVGRHGAEQIRHQVERCRSSGAAGRRGEDRDAFGAQQVDNGDQRQPDQRRRDRLLSMRVNSAMPRASERTEPAQS